jgi:hypothetical protein
VVTTWPGRFPFPAHVWARPSLILAPMCAFSYRGDRFAGPAPSR